MKVIVVDDKNKPNEIPLSKWIKFGQEVTVINQVKCNVQGGLLGYELEEIDLKGCEPYLYFAAYRFSPLSEPIDVKIEKEEEILI